MPLTARFRRLAAPAAFLAVLATALAGPTPLQAQDEVLLSGGARDIGGFGGPVFRVTTVAGETVSLAGGGGALLINRRFAIGGMGVGGTTKVDAIIGGTPTRGEMDFGYGGLTLEVITRPSKLVHATYGVLIGGGGVSVWPNDLRPRDPSGETEAFGVVEPQLGLEVNVVRWLRIGVNGGYRLTYGLEETRLVNNQLDGASGTLVFRFGKF